MSIDIDKFKDILDLIGNLKINKLDGLVETEITNFENDGYVIGLFPSTGELITNKTDPDSLKYNLNDYIFINNADSTKKVVGIVKGGSDSLLKSKKTLKILHLKKSKKRGGKRRKLYRGGNFTYDTATVKNIRSLLGKTNYIWQITVKYNSESDYEIIIFHTYLNKPPTIYHIDTVTTFDNVKTDLSKLIEKNPAKPAISIKDKLSITVREPLVELIDNQLQYQVIIDYNTGFCMFNLNIPPNKESNPIEYVVNISKAILEKDIYTLLDPPT
jgi:hypothetical protein